jgi:uncharacterized protein DUF1918
MKARVGDRLVVAGDDDRVGVVIGLRHEDGSPPYVIRWLSGGHVALVSPGPYARIVPAEQARADDAQPAARHPNGNGHDTGMPS